MVATFKMSCVRRKGERNGETFASVWIDTFVEASSTCFRALVFAFFAAEKSG